MAAVLKKFFIPVKVLSRKFQGEFWALLKQQFPTIELSVLNECYHKEWGVTASRLFKMRPAWWSILGAICTVWPSPITESQSWKPDRSLLNGGTTGTAATGKPRRSLPMSLLSVSDACFAARVHKNSALWISIQSRQVEEAAHLQGTDGTSLNKREKLSRPSSKRSPAENPLPRCGCCGLLRTALAPPTAC